MTSSLTPHDLHPVPPPIGALAPDPRWARAYCGPAHGHTWQLTDHHSGLGVQGWPATVTLGSRIGPQEYRLIHDLRARRPARDDLGNTLYMPVATPGTDRWAHPL